MSLKVVKFDTKMYLNLSNFRGRTSAGGGQALVQKRGQVSDGGDWQNFCRMGDPPVPPQEKNPAGRTALAVRPDVVNAKYHVITNAAYNRDPVPAKFKHVTNIDTCTLLCCDYSTLWEALHVNMVEIGARFSDENVKILVSYQWIG